MTQTLKIGIPDGSMVDPQRGGLKELLDRSRIFTENLETSKIPEVINIPWLEIVMQRPQELPYLATQGYCDAFFCGDDWAREWELRGYTSKKILGLGIGKVNIVVAGKPENEPWRIAASEYPFMARRYLAQETGVKEIPIIRYGEPITDYAVIDSFGKTELKVIYDIADIVIENTRTGKTLENLGLIRFETLFPSECSLYANENLSDSWKLNKVERIAMILKGAVNAQDKDLVIFNVANDNLEDILRYIRKNQLFADEATVKPGENYSEITLELSTTDTEKPFIDILGDLKELGASAIEGIPLSYSIR